MNVVSKPKRPQPHGELHLREMDDGAGKITKKTGGSAIKVRRQQRMIFELEVRIEEKEKIPGGN